MSEDNFDQSQYTTFDFDWSGIDDEYQWVAIDGNGSCNVYTHKPEWFEGYNEWLHGSVSEARNMCVGSYAAGGPKRLMRRHVAAHAAKPATETPPVAKPQQVFKPHPACKHAELMLQYAQDAMVSEKPWELWERTNLDGGWESCVTHPMWRSSCDYRRKPQVVQIEVPVQHKEAVEAYIKQLEKSSG